MSKREQTENLNLFIYNNLRGLPTFLKDWSDNMEILDRAHSSVLESISVLNERLETAEQTLEDLSPENIQDYKIRLDALEKKVVVNTNNIKDVNTKITTINAQIGSINAEQVVQNGRLNALENLTNNHTELISGLRTDLTNITDRVGVLETCCENVNHEITDILNDINGFNDDITVMAGQIETLSNTVSELVDLVNSLQLDVVSQRLSDFEASLTALTGRVTTAESNIIAHGETLEEHDERISDNANDISNLQSEIGNSDYSEIGNTVSSSLVELANRIRALTPQEFAQLINRLNGVENDVTSLQSDVTSLEIGLNDVSADLSVTDANVSTLTTTVENNNTAINTRVNTVQDALTVNEPNSNDTGLIRFGVDANGNYGYKKVGADAVTPFLTDSGEINTETAKYADINTSSTTEGTGQLYSHSYSSGTESLKATLSNPLTIKKGDILILLIGTVSVLKPRLYDQNETYITATLLDLLYTTTDYVTAYGSYTYYIYRVLEDSIISKISIKNEENRAITVRVRSNGLIKCRFIRIY